MSKQNSSQNKKSPVLLVLVVALVVICALLGVIVYLLVAAKNGDDAGKDANKQEATVITADNVDEVVEQMEQKAEEKDDLKAKAATYRVTMSPEWTFKAGETAAVDAYVENSTANSTMVYYTITLEGSQEEILSSPYMEVGSKMTDGEIELANPLEEGTHSAIITYHLVDEEFNELSTVSMYMTIIVEQ